MLLFLDSPTSDADNENENFDNFIETDSGFEIDYDPTNGYEGTGGLVMLLEPK